VDAECALASAGPAGHAACAGIESAADLLDLLRWRGSGRHQDRMFRDWPRAAPV